MFLKYRLFCKPCYGKCKVTVFVYFYESICFSYSMNLMQSAMKKITETFPNTAEVVHENLM